MNEDPKSYEAMAAGEVWQPRPYPAQCSKCGGLGFIYCKVPDGSDAVRPCECRAPKPELVEKRRKRS